MLREDIKVDHLVSELLAQKPTPPPSLDPRHTALLIIDMQYLDASRDFGLGRLARERRLFDLFRYRFERIDEIVPRIKRLAEGCRHAGVQVIHIKITPSLDDGRDASLSLRGVRSVDGTREADILDEIAPEHGDIVISKTSSSAFTSSNIDWILRNLGTRTLIATGIVTSGCVELTMRDAADHGYHGIVVEDCCGANSQALHEDALERMDHGLLAVSTTEEVLRRLSETNPPGLATNV